MRLPSSPVRRASSTSLRIATDAPPACCASQSQWRGNNVISRATTPSFGRPGPRGADGAASSSAAVAGDLRQPRKDVVNGAPEIEIDGFAGSVIEDKDRGVAAP